MVPLNQARSFFHPFTTMSLPSFMASAIFSGVSSISAVGGRRTYQWMKWTPAWMAVLKASSSLSPP